ncbi:MAG: PspA/IM30 family protein [Lachnospiraceae bacterium]
MANILQRFGDIMSANINALLDKAEDPEKMLDQYARDLESDYGKVKAETASVMAAESKAKRELDECETELEKMQSYAQKAVLAGNDADARIFLEKKNQLSQKKESLQQTYTMAQDSSNKMREMYEKLSKDIQEVTAKKNELKAKITMAKTQSKLNQVGGSINGAKGTLSAFDRMEEKANQMLDEANAMAQLEQPDHADTSALEAKYENSPSSTVDDELEALKKQLAK